MFLVVSLVLGASASAQQAPPPPTPPESPTSSSDPVLELSMEQAVTMALETNLGLKADRLGTNIAAQNIAAARAAFRPLLRSSFSRSTSDQLPTNFIESDVSVVSSGSTSVSSSLDQTLPQFGGAYSVRWSGIRSTTTSETNPFNPRTGSSVSLSYNQPLFRNFRIDEARFQLQEAQQNRRIADLTLEQRITRTSNDVQQAYLNLIGAIEGLKVAQQNMDLAQETLKNFRARVAVGVSADIEVIQAEAQVASNEESVVVAEAQIDTSEDALRALILDPAERCHHGGSS
jgi:outer membrane protein TolC